MTDYYNRLGLDPAAPPAAIGAEITARLRTMAPGPERHLHEQARAVLADPAKRRIYDARPPEQWTPDELHALAMAHTAPTVRDRVMTVVGTGTQRILVLTVVALAAILLITVTAVSCSGGSSTPTASSDGGSSPAVSESADPSSAIDSSPDAKVCTANDVNLGRALWRNDGRPDYTLILTSESPLPTELAPFSKPTNTEGDYIVQYQDKNIGVALVELNRFGGQATTTVATFSPDSRLLSTKTYPTGADAPKAFDLMNMRMGGYFRLASPDGITVPAAAAGDEPERTYALTAVSDAFDKKTVWVLLRGGAQLYRANIHYTGDGPCDPQ